MKLEKPLQDGIYTLGQSETQKKSKTSPTAIIKGDGTVLNDVELLSKRAKRKTITRSMILGLVDVAKNENEPDWVKRYWNAYHCQSELTEVEGYLHSTFCKTRYCTVCLAIRKAELINKYLPEIQTWKEPHFVTLTCKAVKAPYLNKRVFDVKRAFKKIHTKLKTRHARGQGIKVIGIKSLECNFNPIKKTYNPHFHIIVPDKETAELLRYEWLKLWTWKFASKKAQNIKKINGLENALIETIKYGSKVFTEPDVNNKQKQKVPAKIYVHALHNIFKAFEGRRLFERFGFNLPPQPVRENKTFITNNFQKWIFPNDETDWVNIETGECLTNESDLDELQTFLKENVDLIQN